MEQWLQEPRILVLLAVVALPMLWLAAGWALRWFERKVARVDARAAERTRGRVTRPFLWDEAEREHRGRVRVGVEIWKARCSDREAESLRVGDRVWLTRRENLFEVERAEATEER